MKRIAGKYELVAPLGEGGMASVWRGLTHGAAGFTRKVAIKRVLARLSSNPEFAAMFVEEARVVSELQHPNIVQVHDFDHDEEGRYFIVMEWIDGLDMHGWIDSFARARLRTPWQLVAAICIEVLRALRAAHERTDEHHAPAPVFHRDVNPANILVGSNGVVKLADFGLARAMDRATMTQPGMVKGKLGYLSPEMIEGAPASAKTDLFALGIVLWEALVGRRLFDARSQGEVVLKVRAAEVPPLDRERQDLPPTLREIVHCVLQRDPEVRFDTADEMLRAMTSLLRAHPEPTDAHPLGLSVRQAALRLKTLET